MSQPIPIHRIAVVGSINKDTIYLSDGREIHSYGGILYAVLPLASLVGPETRVIPVCHIGEDVADAVFALLEAYPGIDTSGIEVVPEPNYHCVIRYDASGRKEEKLLGGVPPLSYERLARFGACDALCLDFVTGLEMSLETLRRLASSTERPIFMDVHSLTLGMDTQRRRFLRRPENWQAWARAARVVQMNEVEGRLLAGDDLDSDASVEQFGEGVLNLGCEALVITLGASGSVTVFRDAAGELEVLRADAAPAGPVTDTTGCGDAFLAGFALAYLRSSPKDPEARLAEASRFANRVAGASCVLEGIERMGEIRRLVHPQAGRGATHRLRVS